MPYPGVGVLGCGVGFVWNSWHFSSFKCGHYDLFFEMRDFLCYVWGNVVDLGGDLYRLQIDR